MNLLTIFLGAKANEIFSELQQIVEQGKIDRGAELWLQIEEEYPALSDTFKALVFKSPEVLASTLTTYTGFKFDKKGIANLGKIQAEVRKMRFKR